MKKNTSFINLIYIIKKKKESYHRCFDREESFHISNINDLQEFRDDDGLRRKSQSVFTQ